ncbi:hypothetical protein [Nesterenkonia sphaerica]|uniref:hypothetical protein n=1 Tax=Nesterenkonia sphaerica TaxID=1804988 RepID=UPI00140A4817|nr:hypothetical protein [Nesterenkonia sphaerica]
MYAWLFRRVLPGPLWFRILTSVVLLAAAVYGLMQFVFPVLSEYSPLGEVTLDGG